MRHELSYLVKALRRPERAPGLLPIWKSLLLRPAAFEFVATLLQLRDGRRLRRLADRPSTNDAYFDAIADYNAKVTLSKSVVVGRSAEPLLRLLAMPPRDLSGESLLLIGPRTVQELYFAWLHGFSWKNLIAIDLYSTSPKIRVMNMEDMDFPDESFDDVIASKTVSYAKDLGKCLAEIARVLRPGGRFAFTHTHTPDSTTFRGSIVPETELREILDRNRLSVVHFDIYRKVNEWGQEATVYTVSARKAGGDLNWRK